jgi:hypothetical protein
MYNVLLFQYKMRCISKIVTTIRLHKAPIQLSPTAWDGPT